MFRHASRHKRAAKHLVAADAEVQLVLRVARNVEPARAQSGLSEGGEHPLWWCRQAANDAEGAVEDARLGVGDWGSGIGCVAARALATSFHVREFEPTRKIAESSETARLPGGSGAECQRRSRAT